MPPRKIKTIQHVGAGSSSVGVESATIDRDAKMRELYLNYFKDAVKKYGEKVAVLLEIGSFFEFFDIENVETGKTIANIRTIADILGMVPSIHKSSEAGIQNLFWGFPNHALNKYESMLINAGYTCMIIVQVKDGGGAVKDRKIDHVSSPGTYWAINAELEENIVASTGGRKEEQGLICILIEEFFDEKGKLKWQIGSSTFEITTGTALSVEQVVSVVDDKPILDLLEPFWTVYPPAEIIVWFVSSNKERTLNENQVCSWFSGLTKKPPVHIHIVNDRLEIFGASALRIRNDFLKSQFCSNTSLDLPSVLGLERHPFALACIGLLLEFVKDHVPSLLGYLYNHNLWTNENEVYLGNAALEQLGMISNNSAKSHECLLYWLDNVRTPLGKIMLRKRLLQPTCNIELLEDHQTRIESLRSLEISKAFVLEKGLRGITNLNKLGRKISLEKCVAMDLVVLLSNLMQCKNLIKETENWVAGLESEYVMELNDDLFDPLFSMFDIERLKSGIVSSSTNSRCIGLGNNHCYKIGIHHDLDLYETQYNKHLTEVNLLLKEWNALLKVGAGADAIKLETKDDIPFVVTTTQRRSVELQTVIKVKGLLPINVSKGPNSQVLLDNEFLTKANKEAQEIRTKWTECLKSYYYKDLKDWYFKVQTNGLFEFLVDFIGTLDTDYCLAKCADNYGYCRPSYKDNSEGSFVMYEALRHPIIERIKTDSPYVPHSLKLGNDDVRDMSDMSDMSVGDASHVSDASNIYAQNGILLYGVNASGKSSLSKAIGLSVLLASCGCPVPATKMTIAPYKSLYTRILGNDNLWAGQSSFAVEMTEFRSILNGANKHSLVLGDELCAGTETDSATAIVAAGIHTLVQKGAQFLFATHLHELLEIPEIKELGTKVKPYHLKVHSDVGSSRLIYDRTLHPGAGISLYGLEVCRGLDMDKDFLAKAFEIRSRFEGSIRESRYNASVLMKKCAICGSKEKLEAHHIIHQSTASTSGFVAPGVHKHSASNLVPLCASCHDLHHGKKLEIYGWKDTSSGKILHFEYV